MGLHGHGHDIRGAESRLGLGELRRYYYLSRLQPNCSIRTAIYILPRNGLPIRVVSYITSLETSTLGGDVNIAYAQILTLSWLEHLTQPTLLLHEHRYLPDSAYFEHLYTRVFTAKGIIMEN